MEGSIKKNMNKNIDTFNKWAKEDKDKSMQLNHTASVEEMFKIIHNETDKFKYEYCIINIQRDKLFEYRYIIIRIILES